MKQVMLLELATSDIVWLAWAAGVAVGQENEDASSSLNAMLQRIQFVEVPEEKETDKPEEDWENEGGTVIDLIEREPDPRFVPPPPAPPMNRQEDFGAGPPKSL